MQNRQTGLKRDIPAMGSNGIAVTKTQNSVAKI